MSTAFISEWGQFTDSPTAVVSGATPNYGGAKDWPRYWHDETQGGVDQTEFQSNLRTAPAQNLTTRVTVTRANDLPLLKQDLSSIQLPDSLLYSGTNRSKAATQPPSIVWNGFAWVSTTNSNYSSTPVASFGGASVPHS